MQKNIHLIKLKKVIKNLKKNKDLSLQNEITNEARKEIEELIIDYKDTYKNKLLFLMNRILSRNGNAYFYNEEEIRIFLEVIKYLQKKNVTEKNYDYIDEEFYIYSNLEELELA